MKRNRLLSFVMAALAALCLLPAVAMAQDESTVFECNQSTGAWTASNSSGTWASNWRSTLTTPTYVDVNSGVNNMTYTDGSITCYGGTSKSCTLAFSTGSDGYNVTRVEFDMAFVKGAASAITVTLPDGTVFNPSADDQAVSFTARAQSTYITIAGANEGITMKNLKVTVAKSSAAPITTFKVFDNSGSVPYRIPAICTMPDGTLLAVADYRYSKADIGNGRIDLHVRTSADNGRTWGDVIMPEQMTGDGNMTAMNMKAGYGDPCAVADRESGRVLVVSCAGLPGFFAGTRTNHMGWARWTSDDKGLNWTEPTYLQETCVYEPFDNSAYGQVRGWFIGSGKIHQSRYTKVGGYYRLYCAGSSYNGSETANWVVYSDDFGQTWSYLGGNDVSPVPGGDEPKVEELPNGNIVISSRNVSGRYFNIFHFADMEKGEGYWETRSLSSSAVGGLIANNGCNGEIGIYPVIRKADGVHTWIALQSLPISGRTNVSIFYKDLEDKATYSTPADFAKDWTKGIQVSTTTSAYSTWSMCKDHTLAFLYEENSSNSGYDIVYKNLSIEQVTDSAYTYDIEKVDVLGEDVRKEQEQTRLNLTWSALKTGAQTVYDRNTTWVDGEAMITDAGQLSSPYSQNDLGVADGGNLSDGVLIDNNASTYWHTYWGGGDVTPGTHYLLVEAAEDNLFTGELKLAITRRAAANDHPLEFAVYGSDAEDGEYTELSVMEIPNPSAGAVVKVYTNIGDGQYRFLKFLCTRTDKDRGYWHAAEFQLYPVSLDPNCKNAMYPEAAAAMKVALKAADEVVTPTQNDIDALQNAYDAYKAALPQAASEETMQKARTLLDNVGNVGYPKASSTEATRLQTLYDGGAEATTDVEMDAAIAALYKCTDIVTPENGKWYTMSFVGADGAEYWKELNETGDTLVMLAAPSNGDNGKFKWIEDGENTYFKTSNDKVYRMYGCNTANISDSYWLKNATATGLQDEWSELANISFNKDGLASSYNAYQADYVFGLGSIQGHRGTKEDGTYSDGYETFKYSAQVWDGAGAVFGNANFTGWVRLTETEAPPFQATYLTAEELRADAETLRIALLGVTSTGDHYINGEAGTGHVSSTGKLADIREPQAAEILNLEKAADDTYYIVRETDGRYFQCNAGGNLSLVDAAEDATPFLIQGMNDNGFGSISGYADLYSDIQQEVNQYMIRFIANNQYLNGQGYNNVGGLRGGTGAWSFQYVVNMGSHKPTGVKGLDVANGSKAANGSNGKFIQNRRIVIVRDGVRYNAAGQVLQ